MSRRLIAVLMAAVASGAAASPPAKQADAKLDRALERLVTMADGAPGVIAVVQRGDEIRVHSFGTAELGTDEPLRVDDHLRIASVAKAFSGAVALALVDAGMLSLDDTIGKWLPDQSSAWHAVTLRQLLAHTSGVPDLLDNRQTQEAIGESPTVAPPPDRLLQFIQDEPLSFPPGSKYHYSNSDNILVALMVQAATGASYEDALQRIVFSPLALTQTSLPRGPELPEPFIHGYQLDPPDEPEDFSEAVAAGWAWASGGIVGTPGDLNRFVRGYVGQRLFGADVQADQFAFVAGGQSEPRGPGWNSAGLAIFRYETHCGAVYGHTGNIFGYTQLIAASADGRRSLVVSTNAQLTETVQPKTFEVLLRAELRAVCAALA